MPSFLLESIGWVASKVAIYLICGQSRCLSARGILSIRHLLLGFFATKYKLDTETRGSTAFRNPRARGCSARGFLKAVDPIGRGI